MGKNRHRTSTHHLIPRANDDGTRFTENKENKEVIDDNRHINHHRIFGSETPQQQLIHILKFNEKIWNDEFVKELIKVLDKYIYNYYKVGCHITAELGDLLSLEQKYFNHKK